MKKLTARDRQERQAVKIEMAKRGISQLELARLTGLAEGTIYNVLSGGNNSAPARAAINVALGRNIFSNPEIQQPFNSAQRRFEWLRDKIVRSGDLATKGATRLVEIPEDAWVITKAEEGLLMRDIVRVTKRHIRKNYVPRKKALAGRK